MSTDIIAYDEPCLSLRLVYTADEGEGPAALAEQAITAIDALAADWLDPLAWEMYLECLDIELANIPEECGPPQPYWLLRKERIPDGVDVDPTYGNHTVVTEPVLSSDRLQAWVARALAQTCEGAPRFIPCWGRFDTLAIRTRLPDAMRCTGDESLSVNCYAGTVAIPLDQLWVSGPPQQYLIAPPVKLIARNIYGNYINLDLAAYWSLWINHPAGRAQVEAAVDRVLSLDRGWQRSED
jgi:hypothetical protein